LSAFGGFFLSIFKKIKGLLCGKRAEGRTEGRRVSRLVPGIKPIGYAKPEGDAEFCEASALPDAVESNKDALGEAGFGNEPTREVADSACTEATAEGNSEMEKNGALHIGGVATEGCFGEAVASESGLEGRAAAEGSDSIVTPDGCVNGYSDGVLASKGCVEGCSDGFIAPEGCADGGEGAEVDLASGGSNEGDGLARGGEGEEPALVREDHAEL
jgi:hypothetical protein